MSRCNLTPELTASESQKASGVSNPQMAYQSQRSLGRRRESVERDAFRGILNGLFVEAIAFCLGLAPCILLPAEFLIPLVRFVHSQLQRFAMIPFDFIEGCATKPDHVAFDACNAGAMHRADTRRAIPCLDEHVTPTGWWAT